MKDKYTTPPHFSKFLGNFLHIRVKIRNHTAQTRSWVLTPQKVSARQEIYGTREKTRSACWCGYNAAA